MIGAAICIGTAVLIAYFLGRYQGMAAAFESIRPKPLSDWATDDRTTELEHRLSHNGTDYRLEA